MTNTTSTKTFSLEFILLPRFLKSRRFPRRTGVQSNPGAAFTQGAGPESLRSLKSHLVATGMSRCRYLQPTGTSSELAAAGGCRDAAAANVGDKLRRPPVC